MLILLLDASGRGTIMLRLQLLPFLLQSRCFFPANQHRTNCSRSTLLLIQTFSNRQLRGTDMTTKRTEAFQAYEEKNYKASCPPLQRTAWQQKKESEILFLLGNTNLMLGQVTEAKENFVTLINDFDDMDLQAKWYLSLCYLKSDDRENARKMLRELGETEISYASKAKELLEKID